MKCAIYIRVSTDKEEQKSSLQNQRELFINFIQEHNWELYDFYVDIEFLSTHHTSFSNGTSLKCFHHQVVSFGDLEYFHIAQIQ